MGDQLSSFYYMGQWLVSLHLSYDNYINITYILNNFSFFFFFFFRQNMNRKVVLVVQGWTRSERGENRWDEVF